MSDTPSDHRQAVALFRYGLIADLAQLPPGTKGLYDLIRAKAERDYVIPGSTRTRVAPETLRDWLRHYRRGGFEALLPKPRADRGRPRALPPQVVDVLLGIKEGNPKLSVQLVIREARNHPAVPPELPLPPATVHRLLARHGLMARSTDDPGEADRRRFAFQRAGELWMVESAGGIAPPAALRTGRDTLTSSGSYHRADGKPKVCQPINKDGALSRIPRNQWKLAPNLPRRRRNLRLAHCISLRLR
jgi:putative transposase